MSFKTRAQGPSPYTGDDAFDDMSDDLDAGLFELDEEAIATEGELDELPAEVNYADLTVYDETELDDDGYDLEDEDDLDDLYGDDYDYDDEDDEDDESLAYYDEY